MHVLVKCEPSDKGIMLCNFRTRSCLQVVQTVQRLQHLDCSCGHRCSCLELSRSSCVDIAVCFAARAIQADRAAKCRILTWGFPERQRASFARNCPYANHVTLMEAATVPIVAFTGAARRVHRCATLNSRIAARRVCPSARHGICLVLGCVHTKVATEHFIRWLSSLTAAKSSGVSMRGQQ